MQMTDVCFKHVDRSGLELPRDDEGVKDQRDLFDRKQEQKYISASSPSLSRLHLQGRYIERKTQTHHEEATQRHDSDRQPRVPRLSPHMHRLERLERARVLPGRRAVRRDRGGRREERAIERVGLARGGWDGGRAFVMVADEAESTAREEGKGGEGEREGLVRRDLASKRGESRAREGDERGEGETLPHNEIDDGGTGEEGKRKLIIELESDRDGQEAEEALMLDLAMIGDDKLQPREGIIISQQFPRLKGGRPHPHPDQRDAHKQHPGAQ
jgi:hypothetical protein